MAVCRYCFEEMTSAVGCAGDLLHHEGARVERIPFGSEWRGIGDRCGDCGVLRGHLHHLGCGVERCPLCFRQMIMCGCRFDEDAADVGELYDLLDDGDDTGRAAVKELIDLLRPPRQVELLPLDSHTIPLEVKHRDDLASIAEWSPERCADVGSGLLAMAVDAAAHRRTTDGGFHLRRPDAVAMLHRMTMGAEDDGAVLEQLPVGPLALVIEWLSASGALTPDSDPLDALLEPLHAHYGLLPVPERHVCQCFVAVDATCPPGSRVLRLRTGQLRHAKLIGQPGACQADAEEVRRRFGGLLAAVSTGAGTGVEALDVLGRLDDPDERRRFWVFGDAERAGRYDNLYLDDDGRPWSPKPDRRYRTGYRWEPLPLSLATRCRSLPRPIHRVAGA